MPDVGAGRAPDGNVLGFMEQALAGFGQAVADVQDTDDELKAAPEGVGGETPETPDASPSDDTASESADDAQATDETLPAGGDGSGEAPDPLAGYAPAEIRADGQSRAVDGVFVHPEFGAVVDHEAVPRLLERLGQADHYEQANQQLYERNQALERISTWVQRDEKGIETTLTGTAGVEALRVAWAQSQAAFKTLSDFISNAQAGSGLYALDGENKVVLNPQSLRNLATEIQLAQMRAEQGARREVASLQGPSGSAAPIDFKAQGDAILSAAMAFAKVEQVTPSARAKLRAVLPNFVRPATPDDQVRNPELRPGQMVIAPEFHELIKEFAASGTASSAGTANKANQARLAAAAVGTPRGQPSRRPQTPPTKPKRGASQNLFDYQEAAASGRFLAPTDGS